jgi:hypothetical protein
MENRELGMETGTSEKGCPHLDALLTALKGPPALFVETYSPIEGTKKVLFGCGQCKKGWVMNLEEME